MRFLTGFAFVVASLSAAQAPGPSPPVDPNDLWFQTIESGGDSPLKKIGVFVLKTQDEFVNYLTQINDVGFKRPKVDWKEQQIVAVQAKGMSQNGSSIRVRRVHRIGHGIVQIDVTVEKSVLAGGQAGPGSPGTPGRPLNLVGREVYPYAIIQTARFTDKTEVRVITD